METLTDEETYHLQKEFEEELMDSFFKKAPLAVQMGGKRGIIEHIAQTAVDLYEGQMEIEKERK